MSLPDLSLRLALRERLRALRLERGLSQAQVGALLGVNQKRIARIEAAPDLASLGQIQRLVLLLGASISITASTPADSAPVRASLKQGRGRPSGGANTVSSPLPSDGLSSGLEMKSASTEAESIPGTSWSVAWD